MIQHVVAWRLKDSALGNDKSTNARLLKEKLEALPGQIPGLRRLEVGLDFSGTENSADVVLVSSFATKEDLAAYQIHPAHRTVVAFASQIVSERRLIDYETP